MFIRFIRVYFYYLLIIGLNYKLYFSSLTGALSGILFIPQLNQYFITIKNVNGSIVFPIKLTCYLPPVPIILQRIHGATFYYQVEIRNFEPFKAIGKDLQYSSFDSIYIIIYSFL